MCGIAGILGLNHREHSLDAVRIMNLRQAHRGPDDEGTYADDDIALGHRRLSIIDLSPAGHQPMFSADNNHVIVFNGEIYNFREIKQSFPNHQFRSGSDTEVILQAYATHGKECVHLFNGMFAFALWDKNKKELFIARDRLGIKPLYYYRNESLLIFASEIRSLLASDLIPRKINSKVIAEYFTYQTVHAPETIIDNVKMLMPGHHMTITQDGINIEKYWDPVENRSNRSSGKKFSEVCSEIRSLFEDSVKRRLISDVPFGAFLSGGIDSSAVVGQMSKVLDQPVKTFNISFDENEFSESRYARIIADKFRTEHHELILTPADFLHLLPNALKAIDHPSGDGPNSYVVSKITRENGITMALSGLGGDELFAGYPVFNHAMLANQNRWIWKIPIRTRKFIGDLLVKHRPGTGSTKIRQLLAMDEPTAENIVAIGRQIQTNDSIQRLLTFDPPEDRVMRITSDALKNAASLGILSKVSVAEIGTYMQNILLRDTDQMSMAPALEVRVPFLDYTLVEYVLGLGDEYKRPIYPKKLLVESLGDLLPKEIVHRKKMGFVFPWPHWMKNELKELCNLHLQSLSKRPFINGIELLNRWQRFLKNEPGVRWPDLWIAIVLEHWMVENKIQD